MRGFTWAGYVDDDGQLWALQVDRDSVADPSRGWLDLTAAPIAPLPRTWVPRYVVGLDDTGRTQRTRIGNVAAPLWTGEALAWEVEASDGTRVLATVIARVAERSQLYLQL